MRRACGGSGKASASLCFVIGDGLFSWPGVQCVGAGATILGIRGCA